MAENKKVTKEDNVEEIVANVAVVEDEYTIEEYCKLKNLGKYYEDSFTMSFGKDVKKTINDWTKFLLDGKYIKEELIK